MGDARSSGAAGTREERAPIAPGESDVALGDRVKAVQLKGFLKQHRLELGLAVPATINDGFYEKVGIGGKLGYNLADSFAVAARGTYFWQIRSSHVREGQLAFSSQLLNSQVHFVGTLDGIWSPVYGKVAWLGSQIVHFDMYLLAGFGGVSSATGWHVATDFGGGIRFYPKSWLALDAGVVATIYPDQASTVAPSTIEKIVAAQFGLTVYYPFTFEYSHP